MCCEWGDFLSSLWQGSSFSRHGAIDEIPHSSLKPPLFPIHFSAIPLGMHIAVTLLKETKKMAIDETHKNGPDTSLHFRKERAPLRVPIIPVILMDMRGRRAVRKELLGSVQALLKDDRLKGARITDALTH